MWPNLQETAVWSYLLKKSLRENFIFCLVVELSIGIHYNILIKILRFTFLLLQKKWSFPLKISSVNMTKPDLIIFTEEILNGKLHFWCSVKCYHLFFWMANSVSKFDVLQITWNLIQVYIALRWLQYWYLFLPFCCHSSFWANLVLWYLEGQRKTLHKKRSFPLKISSVNVIKSAVSCGFGHIY